MKFFLFFSLGMYLLFASGCASRGSASGGHKAFAAGEYARSAGIYKKAFSNEKNKFTKGEIAFYMGESYRRINQPNKAAAAYSRALRTGFDHPRMRLYYAQSLFKAGKVKEALAEFEKILEKSPNDALAHVGLASCKMIEQPAKAPRCDVKKFDAINSKFSDFSPAFSMESEPEIYFSSMRSLAKKRNMSRITGQGGGDIYYIYKDAKGKWTKPEIVDDPVSTTFDEGALSLSFDGKEMYFTRCRYDQSKVIGAEIFRMKRSGGRWSEPELVPLAGDSLVVAHPAISPDGLTLYFVSDMPGSVGGKDIWKVTRADVTSDWSQPVNVGAPVNTHGDEMFPYVRHDGVLFFSSDGHPGFGGLDVFRLTEQESGPAVVENLLMPINSGGDDFGIVFERGVEKGLFSSSRDNVKGVDNIYEFQYRPVSLVFKGRLTHGDSSAAPEGAFVRVAGNDGVIKKLEVQPDGVFTFDIQPNVDYVFLCGAPGYLNHREKFTTNGVGDDKVFDFRIVLKPR
ncbi:MAG: PD40 domain-containing protein [Marinilabiliaceae bacterium]|nr:PD40 domain-containing protein [Marinilabiliaceae bacterium]